ncbi:uncharacterized protein LOC118492237 [Helianthus annuus]|uniref:uncharacterized protein LOC118492237 n=1 Tax=Helianthus annuus TaxID=4232 RepID=UPI001652DA85|nr:uncharacterized protein LOC118492237 [Helianthus annuus]
MGGSLKACARATALASFSAVVLIFRISIEIFYIYYVRPGHFLVPVSFDPGTFNGQDPPLPWGAILISVTLILLFGELLDYLLGQEQIALFRRAELKTLVNLHGNEAGKGGELTHDETTIIAGALELSEKTASDATIITRCERRRWCRRRSLIVGEGVPPKKPDRRRRKDRL